MFLSRIPQHPPQLHMAGHEWEDWFEREEFIGQISDIRVQNLQVEREMVQKRTFTRWMNLHLEKCDPPIEVHDLFQDIQDGRILMALLEELSGSKLLHGFKKSSHRIFRLNNIAKALSFLEERNVKLVSIDAADVADGNSSIILGLIWNIILFFQIKELTGNIRSQFPSSTSLSSIPTSVSDSDTSHCSTPPESSQSASTAMRENNKAIRKLLQWVQKRTRKYGVAVQDFGKSWTSGLAFLAVIKSIDPSLVDMRKALLRSARENLEDAFRIAHYSLGIPRLLEPEDVTINTPDEQCIITYVSQFLEHFPGIESEEPRHLIEQSVSMGRLNFLDSDCDHIRKGAYRSRVKERSYMFQRDSNQPPPKILISSMSEDRSVMSPLCRLAPARLWSSEDLADSPHVEDISSSVVEDPQEPVREVLTNSGSKSTQLSYTPSPTGSSVPESVVGDSAINSPDSWVESEVGVMPEKLSESQSDSSLCDSGTAWDVYRATPVEVTALDEGFVPSIEDKAPDEQSITESYIDEGIYSLSSLESTQCQGHSEKKYAEAVKGIKTDFENYGQYTALEQITGQSSVGFIEEADCKQKDTSLLEKDEVPRKQKAKSQLSSSNEQPSSGHFEELMMQTSVEESIDKEPECLKSTVDFAKDAQGYEGQSNGQIQSLNEKNNSEGAEEENECQKTDPSLEDKRVDRRDKSGILQEKDEVVLETHDEASEGGHSVPQESIRTKTSDALANMHVINQEGASSTCSEPSMGMRIPLISISSEPEEQNKEGTCDPEREAHAGDEEVHHTEASGSDRTDTNVNRPQRPDELSCDSGDNDGKNPSCLISENVKPPASEQTGDVENVPFDETDEHDRNCSNEDTCVPYATDNMEISEAIQECKFLHDMSQTGNTDKDFTAQTSTDAKSRPVKSQQENLSNTFFQKAAANVQQSALDPVNLELNDDLVGDPIEPMDLFYPDKEDPMFPEPLDTEMQSWPSVLSVSALQPAPASQPLLDDQPLRLLGDEENDKVMIKTNQEQDKVSEPQEQCLLPREKRGGFWGDDVTADGGDPSEAEPQSPGSARENTESGSSNTKSSSRQDEGQFPPVLRHRKGAHFTEFMDNQRAVTTVIRRADVESDFWQSESWELYLLLLLWLLLYCFWLLPQMDLKTLPSQLLNLDH